MATTTTATGDLARALDAVVRGEVSDGNRRLAEYSSDASNYRVVPRVVVVPRDVDDVLATLDMARSTGTPLTMRGGGTSVAGNAVGPGIVLDTSRHLDRVVSVDPDSATAVVQPGAVLDALQAAARPHGLQFGPDPSTHARCTLGGMIGNNACGPRAVAHGRTAENVVELDVVDGTGRRFTAGTTASGNGTASVPGLAALVADHDATIRAEFGRLRRQVSGYGLEHLLDDHGGHLARALVGSEGTCAIVLGATVRLVPIAASTVLVVLGYPDMPAAADDVPTVLAHDPLAVEGLDARLVEVVRRDAASHGVPDLPPGGGWLLVEVGGHDPVEALARAERVLADARGVGRVVASPEAAARLWKIRADGAGLAGRTADGHPAWPGWEDAAVPPERLGAYLRDFEDLLGQHGLDGLLYGHFGDGCVHVRLDLPLADRPDRLRTFLVDAAHLVASHGGSLSGEHGDGRARSELLDILYSDAALDAFERFKGIFDPDDLLNPGVLVRPRPVDADLRRPAALPLLLADRPGGMALAHDGGDLTTAVHRCVGVGACRSDAADDGGVMCPSWVATRDETHSTRGRARVLQEMVNGTLVADGPASPEVAEALDLCLSCKACARDCPAGVDLATYKSEVLHQRYRGRLRPRTHYALGRLPQWARLAGVAPRLVNAALGVGPIRRLVLRAGGMDPRRGVPTFAPTSFRRGVLDRPGRAPAAADRPAIRQVVLWADTFTDRFSPAVGHATIEVLEAAGHEVTVPTESACCGLTWITTGQLDDARVQLRRVLDVLGPAATSGVPIVGMEPSCVATLRQDLVELLPDDPRSAPVAGAVHTLAELLTDQPGRADDDRWQPPRLDGVEVIAQPHCHQHAVVGYEADEALLRATGADVQVLGGCCGLAGNFGMERGHYDVSVAVAEHRLLPALRAAPPGAVFLADGFSCRTQAAQLADVEGVHLAELLAGARDDDATA